MTQKVAMIPLAQLVADENANVRKANRSEGIEQLAASIEHKGVLQSLRVRPNGKDSYLVTAGNRRLAALIHLGEAGKIGGDFMVPCIIVKEDDASAREASLTENIDRLAMSPVDEFKAFRQMVDDGKSKTEIAERFAVPVRRVEQRLKLAGLHPTVLQALDSGRINMEAAQAFTLTNDLERQARYLEKASQWDLNAHHIRHHMTESDLRADSRMAKLIGEEAYIAAGGHITEDLFGDLRFWTSTAVIEKLTAEHFAAETEKWLADGWAWAAPRTEYGNDIYSMQRVYSRRLDLSEEQEARQAEITARMEELSALLEQEENEEQEAEYQRLESELNDLDEATLGYSDSDKARSGVVFDPQDGTVTFGIIDPKKAYQPAADAGKEGDGKDEDAGPSITKALSNRLSIAKNEAIKAKVAGDPRMALEIAVASLHTSARLAKTQPTHINVDYPARQTSEEAPEQGSSFAEALAWCIDQTDADLMAYMAILVAKTIDVTDANIDNYNRAGVDELAWHVDADPLDHFDIEDYSNSVSKPVLIAGIKDIRGGKDCDGLHTVKKQHLAEQLRLEVSGKYRPEGKKWLPPELRNPSYDGPAFVDAKVDEAA